MGARLSEDIVWSGERSSFFRTAPGQFFLREFLRDSTIPEEFRQPVPTRRRFRELVRGPALSIKKSALLEKFSAYSCIEPSQIISLLNSNNSSYIDPRERAEDYIHIRSFVCVRRGEAVLSYRMGRYRENRDSFLNKRSIGFATYVHDFEHTLFNQEDFGILEAGVSAARVDLDMPTMTEGHSSYLSLSKLSHFLLVITEQQTDLLAVVKLECPEWFEPTRRRLALNDVAWLSGRASINDINDLDPWSRAVFEEHVPA